MSEWDPRESPDAELGDLEQSVCRRMVDQFPANLAIAHVCEGEIIQQWVGPGVARIYGCEVEDMYNDPHLFLNVVHPADKDRVKAAFDRLVSSGELLSEEYRVFRADGQMRWVRQVCAAGKDVTGSVTRVIEFTIDVTDDRPQVEKALGLGQVLDGAPNAIAISDLSGRVIYCNKACAEICGYESADEMIGAALDAILPEGLAADSENGLPPVLLEGRWSGETKLHRSDGSAVDVNVSTGPLTEPGGNPVAVYATLEDVTERKRSEQALRESEERYGSLMNDVLESSLVGMFVLDRDFHVVWINAALERYFGLRREEVIGADMRQLIQQRLKHVFADPEATAGKLLASYDDNTYVEGFECHVLPGEGREERWLQHGSQPITSGFYAGGRIEHCTDITDRKLAEQALRNSEERYHTVADLTYNWEYWLDQHGNFVYVSPSCERITGYQPSAFFDDPSLMERIVHADDREMFKDLVEKSRTSMEVLSANFRILRRDGNMGWIGHVCQPVVGTDGELLGRRGSNRDITEQVNAREREAKYAVRMAALAEISELFTSLYDAEEILGLAARRTGELLGAVSIAMSVDQETGRLDHLATYAQDQRLEAAVKEALQSAEVTVRTTFGEQGVEPRIAADMKDVSPALGEFAEKAALGSGIAAPVVNEAEVFCLLACARKENEPAFDQDDLWFLTQVASHTAAALSSAELYERQTRIAETLQRSLIPASPKLDCLDVATCYIPAPGEAAVGGDFFDVIHFGCDVVGIVVGDVSGKGIQAAVHTAEAKYILRGYAHENSDPGYVVTALNEALYTYTGEFAFVTLVYALIDIPVGTVLYVNAGHESPLLLCRDSHTITELAPQGPVLGIVSNQSYKPRAVKLEEDDLLFCYTDGVTDVPSNAERFGRDRLAHTVLTAPHASSQDLLDHVMRAVGEFGGTRQSDDQVIVVARPNV